MKYVLSGILAIILVETLLRLPFLQAIQSSVHTTQKAVSVIFSSSISDHWKERVILFYARVIFLNTLKLSLYLLSLLLPIGAFVVLGYLLTIDLVSFIMGLEGVMVVTLLSIGYAIARKRFV